MFALIYIICFCDCVHCCNSSILYTYILFFVYIYLFLLFGFFVFCLFIMLDFLVIVSIVTIRVSITFFVCDIAISCTVSRKMICTTTLLAAIFWKFFYWLHFVICHWHSSIIVLLHCSRSFTTCNMTYFVIILIIVITTVINCTRLVFWTQQFVRVLQTLLHFLWLFATYCFIAISINLVLGFFIAISFFAFLFFTVDFIVITIDDTFFVLTKVVLWYNSTTLVKLI